MSTEARFKQVTRRAFSVLWLHVVTADGRRGWQPYYSPGGGAWLWREGKWWRWRVIPWECANVAEGSAPRLIDAMKNAACHLHEHAEAREARHRWRLIVEAEERRIVRRVCAGAGQ